MNKLIIPALVFTTAFTIAATVTAPTYAVERDGGLQSLIQQFSERFGLNQEEVEEFAQKHKQERRVHMHEEHQKHLDNLVADGVLTKEQREALEQKHEEMMQSRENYMDLSRQERRSLREEHREQMQEWAEIQGIDLTQIRPEENGFGKHGFR